MNFSVKRVQYTLSVSKSIKSAFLVFFPPLFGVAAQVGAVQRPGTVAPPGKTLSLAAMLIKNPNGTNHTIMKKNPSTYSVE